MKSYKTIADDDMIEARIYKPTKRTIDVGGRAFFLQFPKIIAVKVHLDATPVSYWDMYDSPYIENPSVFLAVNAVQGKFVYKLPLPQTNYTASKLGVCINHKKGHVFCECDTTLDEMMDWFWFTSFYPDGNISCTRFDSFHNWSTLNLNDVVDLLKHSDPRCTIVDYLEELRGVSRKVSILNKSYKEKMQNEYQTTRQDGDSW